MLTPILTSPRRARSERLMPKQTPTVAKLLTMVVFAVSCFGLLMFLWLSFGGPIPLKPKGYRVQVAFPEATTLAEQADVRIAGVSVGKVVHKDLDKGGNRTLATIQLDRAYSPIPSDTRTMLRQKTLLGETYVELQPGRSGSELAEGGRLPDGQVTKTVELDEIFDALDPKTRDAFRTWQQELGRGIEGHGRDVNDGARDAAGLRRRRRRRLRRARLPGRRGAAARQEHRGDVRRAQPERGAAAQPHHVVQARVRRDGVAERVAGRDDPDLPDVPGRVQGHARAPEDVLAGHRPADQGPAPGRPRPQADAPGRPRAGAGPRELLHEPRPADPRVADGSAGHQQDPARRQADARRARPVPQPGQPDPRVPRAQPEPGLGLHHQRGGGRGRHHDVAVGRRRALPAPDQPARRRVSGDLPPAPALEPRATPTSRRPR